MSLKWIFENPSVEVWAGFNWHRIRSNGKFCVHDNILPGTVKEKA